MTFPMPTSAAGSERCRICVGIATLGRPDQLASMLDNLARQTVRPDTIMICCTKPEDVGALASNPHVVVIYDQPGSSRQRNAILAALPAGTDYVVFFDDDFYPDPRWLECVDAAFQQDASIVGITGHVVADGIVGPGLSQEEALARIVGYDPAESDYVIDSFSPYGCNMAFRCKAIENIRFDERLVLYGWLEDRDFGATLRKRGGRLIKLGAAFGAHLGIKRGRVSGLKFGYSQVMNPIYIHRKSNMTTAQVIWQVGRNVSANLLKSLRPEPYVDRRGRLRGNFIAAGDLLRLRLTPERAATL